MLAAMAQNMEDLREQNEQTSEILTTLGTMGIPSLNESLEVMACHAASHITNPYIRSGFQRAMMAAFKDVEDQCQRDQQTREDSATNVLAIGVGSQPLRRSWHLLESESSKTVNTFFGDVTVQARNYQNMVDKGDGSLHPVENTAENRIRFIFRPAAWIMRLGLAYELRLAVLKSS